MISDKVSVILIGAWSAHPAIDRHFAQLIYERCRQAAKREVIDDIALLETVEFYQSNCLPGAIDSVPRN